MIDIIFAKKEEYSDPIFDFDYVYYLRIMRIGYLPFDNKTEMNEAYSHLLTSKYAKLDFIAFLSADEIATLTECISHEYIHAILYDFGEDAWRYDNVAHKARIIFGERRL